MIFRPEEFQKYAKYDLSKASWHAGPYNNKKTDLQKTKVPVESYKNVRSNVFKMFADRMTLKNPKTVICEKHLYTINNILRSLCLGPAHAYSLLHHYFGTMPYVYTSTYIYIHRKIYSYEPAACIDLLCIACVYSLLLSARPVSIHASHTRAAACNQNQYVFLHTVIHLWASSVPAARQHFGRKLLRLSGLYDAQPYPYQPVQLQCIMTILMREVIVPHRQ